MSGTNNKKRSVVIAVIVVILIAIIVVLAVCISKNKGNKNSDTQTQAQDTVRSGQIDIDYEKQVSKLADYTAIPVSLASDYEVTDEARQEYLTSILLTYGADAYKQVTDRDVAQDGDYVKVDYTGYQGEEAFTGGSATDVLLDVSANSQVGGGGFIDGFTAPIIGAKVGETVSSDITFPEDYGNTELAGVTVKFEYTIKGIYSTQPCAFEDLTDEQVNTLFGATAGVSTVDALKTQIDMSLQQTVYSATVDAVKNYMIENSTVSIPDEYFQARLNEFIASFKEENVTDGQTLEEFLSANYNMTVDDATERWTESLEKQIQVEFIFGLVAEKEDIEMDEDAFSEYVNYIISASNSQFENADVVYEYFGNGNSEEGETYLKEQYLVNKAIDKVAGSAEVTFTDSASE